MKKIISFLLALSILSLCMLSLISCSNGSGNSSDGKDEVGDIADGIYECSDASFEIDGANMYCKAYAQNEITAVFSYRLNSNKDGITVSFKKLVYSGEDEEYFDSIEDELEDELEDESEQTHSFSQGEGYVEIDGRKYIQKGYKAYEPDYSSADDMASLSVLENDSIEINESTAVERIYDAYKNGTRVAYIVRTCIVGYSSDICIDIVVNSDGTVLKAVVTKDEETHGQQGMDTYTERFAGLDAEGVSTAELYTNATVTSSAIRSSVLDAVNTVMGTNVEVPDEPQ